MEDLHVCRFCLATGNKLLNITLKQESDYQALTGTPLQPSSMLPHYICTYCNALLVKCATFKQRCIDTQNILSTYVLLTSQLTFQDIDVLRRENSTALPYEITTSRPPIEISFYETDIKQEYYPEDDMNNCYDETQFTNFTDDDDDEPLSKKAAKQKKKILIVNVKSEDIDIFKDLSDHLPNNIHIDAESPVINDSSKSKRKKTAKERDRNKIDDGDFTIVELTKDEQIAEIEARKTSSNYLNCLYKCDKCYKGFITENTFKNHMIKHDPLSGEYPCDICHVRFSERRALRNHSLVTHERQYVCKRCGHVDKCAYKASVHLRWHNGHVYTCEPCGATFSKPTTYLTHVRSAHRSAHECVSCGETFLSNVGLSMHVKKAHTYLRNTTNIVFKCTECPLRFKNVGALNKHKEYCNNGCDNTSACLECGEHFESRDTLKKHSKIHRKDYNCDLCGRCFSSARSLGRHACVAASSERNEHPAAGHNAGHATGPTVGHNVSTRSEPYVCHVCGATLSSKNSWTYHLRIHTGEKPFSCNYCPKTFSVHQRLKIHIRGHTGERPLQCARCPKAFRHRAALARHERVHTGVKPYRCPRCHKCFSQSNSCKLHLRTVHMRRQDYTYSKNKDIDNKE